MQRKRILAAAAMAVVLAMGLTACGGDDPTGAAPSPAASASATDVAFAQSMIAHHEQAVLMADMALDPASGASKEVQDLAGQIKAAQGPEIEQMTGWLQDWGQPTAMPGSGEVDGMEMGDHDMGGMTVSGMMSQADMDALAGMTGQDFDQMWLEMMVAHHQGAIEMAGQVLLTTTNPEVSALAQDIIDAQRTEITVMQGMLQ